MTHERVAKTLVASWELNARAARGARVIHAPSVTAAVFPHGPERAVYNNALLDGARGIDAMEAAYASAGIAAFAAWAHESDTAALGELEGRGYCFSESNRAMGMALSELRVPRPALDLAEPDWSGYLRLNELPPGFLADIDPSWFHVRIARLDGERVAAAVAFDHDGDCGIYSLHTAERARRRGIGTALTALLLHEARARGCHTATVVSTPMAERVYAAVGFRDFGRFLEHAAPQRGQA
jgi:ribosomal protein S18 acetylase RimI-like enzyme